MVSTPAVIAPFKMRPAPRHSTKAVQAATVRVTTGDRMALIFRAFSADSTVAQLAFPSCSSSNSCLPNALITRSDSRPCCATVTISLWFFRTSLVAFLTAFLNRTTKSSRNGVTPIATSAKSQFRQNIRPSILTMVNRSTSIPRVPEEAKF